MRAGRKTTRPRSQVLAAKDEYLIGLEIISTDSGVSAEIRAKSPGLFPAENMAQRYVGPGLQHAFIAKETGLPDATIEAVLAADDEYMRDVGILDGEGESDGSNSTGGARANRGR